MHIRHVLNSRQVTRVSVLPTIHRFKIPVDLHLPHGKWGWCSLDQIGDIAQHFYRTLGCPSADPLLPQYESFFPSSGAEVQDPIFSWVIVKENGQYIFEQGDMGFCPFPNLPDRSVQRTSTADGALYVPAEWANAVLDLVEGGAVALLCDRQPGASDRRNHLHGWYYSMLTCKGEKVSISGDSVALLAPPNYQQV